MANDTIGRMTYRPHSQYWFEDGSLILLSYHNLYKVHKTLLLRHSPTLTKWISQGHLAIPMVDDYLLPQSAGSIHVKIPDDIRLRNEDLEALLEHLYHDV